MPKTAIFVSDMHMGRGDALDNFRAVNEKGFLSFLETKSKELRGEVDLVLLGDTFDVWQVASESEKNAPYSKQIDVSGTVGSEAPRMKDIILRHQPALDALRQFAQGDAGAGRLYLIIGNHDHTLVEPQIQREVRNAVIGKRPVPPAQIIFAHYYDSPQLGLYAEHGHQYEDSNKYNSIGGLDACAPKQVGFSIAEDEPPS